MGDKVRVRFAPSPTGALHVGSARAALFNWLYAKNTGGTMILRIEDTDMTRSTDESTKGIVDGLRWLGLDWDEGPEVGGPFGPYFQSERQHLYTEYADKLKENGMAYECFCTPEELDARRKALQAAGKPPKYDRRCRNMDADERRSLIESGRPYVLRFYSTDVGETQFYDLIRGDVKFSNDVLDDLVIIRSDKLPTYNFAVVVDDHLMAITHVVRGEDHISNTPRQVQLYEALDLPVPEFAHLPMILGPDRSKLSKRHGAKAVMEFAEDGYLPEAIVNYLALLGWAYDDSQELFDVPHELIDKFSLEKVSKNPAIFDFKKFEWMNGVYMRRLKPEQLVDRALPLMQGENLLPVDVSDAEKERFALTIAAVQSRLKTMNEIVEETRYFFAENIEYDEKAVEKFLRRDYSKKLIERVLEELVSLQPFDEASIEAVFDALGEQLQLKKVDLMQPVRVAVTGRSASPGIYETLSLLGRAKACERLRAVLADMKQLGESSSENAG